jgi:hypothetical protein
MLVPISAQSRSRPPPAVPIQCPQRKFAVPQDQCRTQLLPKRSFCEAVLRRWKVDGLQVVDNPRNTDKAEEFEQETAEIMEKLSLESKTRGVEMTMHLVMS